MKNFYFPGNVCAVSVHNSGFFQKNNLIIFLFLSFFCAKRLLQTIWPSFTFKTISSLSAERSAGHFFNFLFRLQLTSSQSISIYSSEQGIFFPYLIIIFLAFPKAVLTVLEKTCYSKVPIFPIKHFLQRGLENRLVIFLASL